MAVKQQQEAQNPLILRCNRLIEAFAKSDDERDFYLDRLEGFILYVDLDKPEEELQSLERELLKHADRYCMIPKLTFYETKKIMEGFVNEKVYDIDTKEKLLDIIQSKEARENFLDFIYDHHSELEKWQTYYQERSRIRIIEWLRNNHFHFVFEEDLEMPKSLIERLKKDLFQSKVGKDIATARKSLISKAKTYYSNEALNPRPKRGRPPKQAQKAEIEHQITTDIYTTVPHGLRSFLFIPDLGSPSSATFSSKFGNEEELFTNRRAGSSILESDLNVENLNQKLAALRSLSEKWVESEKAKPKGNLSAADQRKGPSIADEEEFDEFEGEEDLEVEETYSAKGSPKRLNGFKAPPKGQTKSHLKMAPKKGAPPSSGKLKPKKIIPSKAAKTPSKSLPKFGSKSSSKPKPNNTKAKSKPPIKGASKPSKPPAKLPTKPSSKTPPPKKKVLRPIMKLKKKIKK